MGAPAARRASSGRQLYEQGLKVYTTLDLDLQAAAERALERQIRAIEAGSTARSRTRRYERYMARADDDDDRRADNSPYLQGAFVAMDPRTGAVRALVGGRDFDDSKFNRAVQAVRQPGSTFKPIVYADAVQNGRPLSYILDDSPLTRADMSGGVDVDAAELRGQLRGQDSHAPRALSVAQRADDPARHGARHARA